MKHKNVKDCQTGRKACKKMKAGSVIAIPFVAEKWVIAQVLYKEIELFIAISLTIYDSFPNSNQIYAEKFELFSRTTDGELYRGNWWFLGDEKIPLNFAFPDYRVCYDGQESVMSFFGDYIRPFDALLDQGLRPCISRSPKMVESVIRTAFGMSDRYEDFEEMKIL